MVFQLLPYYKKSIDLLKRVLYNLTYSNQDRYYSQGEFIMRYEGTVYRPPSEAGSLIIQLTIGCARNQCTFCGMYKDKKFRVRNLDEVAEDLYMARKYDKMPVRRIFLADGDALTVKTSDLLFILDKINKIFPECERVSIYGAPGDILNKSPEALKSLKASGLDMVYMGAESGDDQVLEDVKKGAAVPEIIAAGLKVRAAGMTLSVTFISGLGGKARLKEHAQNSATMINAMKPEYVGFLTLMLEPGTQMYAQLERGEFTLLSPEEVLEEMELVVSHIDSDGTIFRANHASNYVALRGTFNKDKGLLLSQIKEAGRLGKYRPESFRGL